MEQSNDEKLWRIARKRAMFKKSLYSYLVVNAFLWAIWWITTGRVEGSQAYPWPVWVMLGWGLGLGLQYFGAYQGTRQDLASEEFRKLKEKE